MTYLTDVSRILQLASSQLAAITKNTLEHVSTKVFNTSLAKMSGIKPDSEFWKRQDSFSMFSSCIPELTHTKIEEVKPAWLGVLLTNEYPFEFSIVELIKKIFLEGKIDGRNSLPCQVSY